MKKVFLVGLVSLAFMTCSPKATIKPTPVTTNHGPVFHNVTVVSNVPDSTEEAAFLQSQLYKKLGKRTDTTIFVTINHLVKKSRMGRLWWGPLTGSAELRATVQATTPQGQRNFQIDTTMAGTATVSGFFTGYGGSTEDLLARAADKIMQEISK